MMGTNRSFLVILLALMIQVALTARDKLPEWCLAALAESHQVDAPVGANAWVLLDRSEFTCTLTGAIKQKHYRLVKVLTEKGAEEEAFFAVRGIGGKASRVKGMKGWNFRPNAEPLTVEQEDALVLDPDSDDTLTSDNTTAVNLPGVVPGSLLAFESQEIFTSSMGPVAIASVLGANPILRWELELDKSWFVSSDVHAEIVPWNLDGWTREIQFVQGRSLKLRNLPAGYTEERQGPEVFNSLPIAFIRFTDRSFPAASSASWSDFGGWYQSVFKAAIGEIPPLMLTGTTARERLQSLQTWMGQNLGYRQVYLSENRGWMPAKAADTLRRRSGDCKDLTAFSVAILKAQGFEAFPVLTRVSDGRLLGTEPIHPGVFNHVLTAIALPAPMGFAAEVRVGLHTFLLLDPTDKLTPLGYLGRQHAGSRFLLCLPNGGEWVTVGEDGIMPSGVEVAIEATAEPEGRLLGTLTMSERGNALGLARAYLERGQRGLEDRLFPMLAINPACAFAILSANDPLVLGQSFNIKVEINLEAGWQQVGPHGALAPIAIPPVMGAIQRPGRSRQLPVQIKSVGRWLWSATIHLPGEWDSVTGAGNLHTTLREVSWASVCKEGTAKLVLDSHLMPGTWKASEGEFGVKFVDADRADYASFLSRCFEFKSRPAKEP
ncbi:MAG TPA: transglutaminase domain-containing protein [Geothrix sp.]|nr:transglutaminase domain-containing protein [Geothrix sp.]